MSIEVIIPTYNEEKRIGPMLESYVNYFDDNHVLAFTVILNGCRDHTKEVVEKIRRRFPTKIRIKEVKEAIGKGGAVVKGMRESESDIVGFVDADGSTPPSEFKKLLNAMNGADGAIASRFLLGAEMKRSFSRSFISTAFRCLVRCLFHLPFQDTQCGAKIFKTESIKKILPNLKISNMAFDVELLVEGLRAGLKIKEIPTRWLEAPHGSVGTLRRQLKVGWGMAMSLFYLRFFKSFS